MQKSRNILTIAMLCLGVAAPAQSSVQINGLVDVYAGSLKRVGDAQRKAVLNSSGMTTSWFGFSGSEDLGAGLKANFMLNAFFQPDSGTPGRFVNDTFFSRDAFVGLSGGFGEVKLGRFKSPNFLPSVFANPLGDSFTFSPLIVHKNVPLLNSSQWQATTPADTGWANQIGYTTPNVNGFQANLQYQFGEQPGESGKNNVGLNFFYTRDALRLTGYWERDQIRNPAPNEWLGTSKKDWMLAGSYDFKVLKSYVSYGQSEADNAPGKAKTLQLGAAVPLGAGKLLASWAKTELNARDVDRTTFTIGYDHDLSKRTDVYAMLMNDKMTRQTSGTSFGVGIRHRF